MILLGTQYYRPPFPEQKFWEDDIARIADSGLNTLQLWVIWAWVEAKPGVFNFDDYDKLVWLAGKYGLKVVLSTIAEVQPYWIHNEIPGSEMIDNMGNTVISSNRVECHYGITPGGCFDHSGIWDRMAGFLEAVVNRYRSESHLAGWDAWNELRWNVHADGLVCYCQQTQKRFRQWLDSKYCGLDGLNKYWKRRYQSWDEVMPGKLPRRSPYTEMMSYCAFMSWRSNCHARDRYKVIKKLDPDRPVTVHGAKPSHHHCGQYPQNMPLDRGNDWDFAENIDGVGTSSFPVWFKEDDAAFAARIESSASAAGKKSVWLSELQGGRASLGFDTHGPVPADRQQRWIWTGLSRSADAILFWCWRDEVFGYESAGFGLEGSDGFADQRLAALKQTSEILNKHGKELQAFVPQTPRVGVFFSPWSYYLHWVEEQHGETACSALLGYQRALVKQNIPHMMIEEAHLDCLDDVTVLFMPRTVIVDDPVAEKLRAFVERGGTLVCESDCGSFDSAGIYRYPQDRFLASLTGIADIGRRTLETDSITAEISGKTVRLAVSQWLTPFPRAENADVWASNTDGTLVQRIPCGKGAVVLCGCYFGENYLASDTPGEKYNQEYAQGFETFIDRIVKDAGICPEITTDTPQTLVRAGTSDGKLMIFVIATPNQTVSLTFTEKAPAMLHDLISGKDMSDLTRVHTNQWGVAVLTE